MMNKQENVNRTTAKELIEKNEKERKENKEKFSESDLISSINSISFETYCLSSILPILLFCNFISVNEDLCLSIEYESNPYTCLAMA